MPTSGKQYGAELRKFMVPEFVFGDDARYLAGRYARNFGGRKVLVVTDPGVIEAGWADHVIAALEADGLAFTVFSSVSPNPKEIEVMEGAEAFNSHGCNMIVVVGGGSPMDCAKGIGIVCSNGKHVLEFEGVDKVPIPGPPLICVPTTAGTSADVSQFAIINDTHRKLKVAIISKTVVPDVALIDPATTVTMDRHLTACTAMDALTHAIEAYVSNANSPITDLHALEAIRLVSRNLLDALSEPKNMFLRNQLMLGSLHAGLAFSNASLGAVHAMAHSLGGLLDLPHGHCNAILLPLVVDFNYAASPERFQRIGEAMGLDMKDTPISQRRKAVCDEIKRLQSEAGILPTLGALGASLNDLPKLAQGAMQDACMVTNPRRPTENEIERIFENAF
jgi:alcohol dehydrogenase